MGCIFGTGDGRVGVLWEAVFGTEGAYCGWHFGTGVVVWVYCGKQFLVLRVCTVGRIFGTGGGSVGVLWEAVVGTEGVYCGSHFWYKGW